MQSARLDQGSDLNPRLGPYDRNSAMNYCNPVFLNAGTLSEVDKKVVALLYGPND
jgi:hypothetical protein